MRGAMPSNSLAQWRTGAAALLDELADAHKKVGGPKPGRRRTTQQLNHAYALLLASQFQAYCRNLHSEAVTHIVATFPISTRVVASSQFLFGRKLDGGNAHPSALQQDFSRLGFDFLKLVKSDELKNAERLTRLNLLNTWRNAIAHHDFKKQELAGKTKLSLPDVTRFRTDCNRLAKSFDRVVGKEIAKLAGVPAW